MVINLTVLDALPSTMTVPPLDAQPPQSPLENAPTSGTVINFLASLPQFRSFDK